MSSSQQAFSLSKDGPQFSGEFIPVVWRGTTFNASCLLDAVGISFNCEDGSVIRLLLTRDGAKSAGESLIEAYRRYQEFKSFQSESSSGNPSVAVSTPEE